MHQIGDQVIYNLRNANVRNYPYPHFFCDSVFPWEFYAQMREKILANQNFEMGKSYQNRGITNLDGFPEFDFMLSKFFLHSMLHIFEKQLKEYAKEHPQPDLYIDVRLVRDSQGYSIGPHTDAPWKLASLLFYFPEEYVPNETLGTSIFVPKDHQATCVGGPHYSFEPFNKVYTAPYRANSCFGFWKTPYSWHGVEPIDIPISRNVLLYNIYGEKPGSGDHESNHTDNGT